MSFECVNWAYEQPCVRQDPKGLKPGEKFVLVTLANICDENGLCYPGQPYLAARTGFTDRTVLEHLSHLEGRGFIKRWRRTLASGQRTSDLCQLQGPWIEDQPAPDAVRSIATRKKPQGYPKKTTGLPEIISGSTIEDTSETHQGTARERAAPENDQSGLFADPPDPKDAFAALEPSAAKRTRAVQIPARWEPDPKTICWAKSEGFDDEAIRRELAKFADHALAKGSAYRD
jgi:hypothetical protein